MIQQKTLHPLMPMETALLHQKHIMCLLLWSSVLKRLFFQSNVLFEYIFLVFNPVQQEVQCLPMLNILVVTETLNRHSNGQLGILFLFVGGPQ